MPLGSLRADIIINTVAEELSAIANGNFDATQFPRSIEELHKVFPQLSDDKICDILLLMTRTMTQKESQNIELVVTAPDSFALKARATKNVVQEIISSAQKAIIITGYSISDYVSDFINMLVSKSQSGVLVRIYINKADSQGAIDKIVRYQSKYLQVFNYTNETDKMSALHAKIISVDNARTLISSANLSYHGMAGNIELGCLIDSKKTAVQVDELFKQLTRERVFTKL